MSRNRPKKLLAELGTIRLANDLFGRRGEAWPAALGDLLDTARGLKFTLNAVMKTWERIHGEVDIDELIILSALRYRAGPVYSFLVRRALDLRLLGKQSYLETNKQEKERQIDELRTEWKDALSQIDANHLAVAILVGDVFPSAQVITGRSPWYHTNRLQSVASSRGETYMERITAGDVPRGAVRDQKVLLLLNSIAADRDVETFANSFVNSREFAELAVFFDDGIRQWSTEPRIPSRARLAVAGVMLRVESARAGDNLLYQRPTHHLIQHWISNAGSDHEYIRWATDQILTRIPTELFRATELYFDLFRDLHISIQVQSAARKQILEEAQNSFSAMSPSEVAMCFPSHFPYTLAHLIRLDSRTPSEELLTRLEDWQWLKPQLLAGLAERPDILVPHVLPVFGTFGPQPGPFDVYKFDDDMVARFFGTDRETFYRRIILPFAPHNKLDANFRRLLPLAAEEARLILRVIEAEKDPKS